MVQYKRASQIVVYKSAINSGVVKLNCLHWNNTTSIMQSEQISGFQFCVSLPHNGCKQGNDDNSNGVYAKNT